MKTSIILAVGLLAVFIGLLICLRQFSSRSRRRSSCPLPGPPSNGLNALQSRDQPRVRRGRSYWGR